MSVPVIAQGSVLRAAEGGAEAAAVLWEEVQLRHCMGLSVAGRRLVELLRVADSVTNSMLILRLPEEAEYLVVLER